METHFQMSTIVSSNGVVDGTRAVLIRLPQNYYLVIFTNSEDLSATAIFNAGVAAFRAGMEHNFT